MHYYKLIGKYSGIWSFTIIQNGIFLIKKCFIAQMNIVAYMINMTYPRYVFPNIVIDILSKCIYDGLRWNTFLLAIHAGRKTKKIMSFSFVI